MYVPKRQSRMDAATEFDQDGAEANDADETKRTEESVNFLRRPSNTPRVEDAAQGYAFKAMKLIVSDNENCIDRDILRHLVTLQQKRNRGLLSLPFSLTFFFLFAWSAQLHEDVMNVFVIESGLREVLGSGAADIKTTEDTWDWLNTTIFPTVFTQTDARGRRIEEKMEWSRILSYNSMVGPLFLEQERSTKELCVDKAGIATDMYCYNAKTKDTSDFGRNLAYVKPDGALESPTFNITPPAASDYDATNSSLTLQQRVEFYNRPFRVLRAGRRLRMMRPTYQDRLSGAGQSSGIAKEGVFRAGFSPNMRYELIQERLNYLRANGWLDKQTKHLSLRALMLNSEVGRPRLQSYQLVLSFSRAGDVFAKLTMDTVFLQTYYSLMALGSEALFAAMLFGMTVFEIYQACKACRGGNLRKHLASGWFILQFMIVFCGWAVLAGYQYIDFQVFSVKKDMAAIQVANAADIPAELNDLGDDLHNIAANVAFVSAWHRLLVAVYHLLLMIRFFVSFRAQPRLGVVVSTLEVCLVDVLHFMVILLPCFCAYAVSGAFVFGRRIEEFSDIQAAVGICFKIVTESEFDWPYLSEEHYWTSVIWTWTFMLFISLVMLNLVLAIVLDVYSEQRKLAGKSETVPQTFWQLVTVLQNWKRWISSNILLDKLGRMSRMISREEFLKAFPGMPDKQVDLLMGGCKQLAANIHAGPEHQKHTMRMAIAMKVAMDKVARDIEELDNGSYMPEANDDSTQKPKPSWQAEISRELAAQNHAMLTMQWRLQQLNWSWQAMDMAHGKETVFDFNLADPQKPSDIVL